MHLDREPGESRLVPTPELAVRARLGVRRARGPRAVGRGRQPRRALHGQHRRHRATGRSPGGCSASCTGNGKNNFRVGNEAIGARALHAPGKTSSPPACSSIPCTPTRSQIDDNEITVTPPTRRRRIDCKLRVITTRGVRTLTIAAANALSAEESEALQTDAARRQHVVLLLGEGLLTVDRADPVAHRSCLARAPAMRGVQHWQVLVKDLAPASTLTVSTPDGRPRPRRHARQDRGTLRFSLHFDDRHAPEELTLELQRPPEEAARSARGVGASDAVRAARQPAGTGRRPPRRRDRRAAPPPASRSPPIARSCAGTSATRSRRSCCTPSDTSPPVAPERVVDRSAVDVGSSDGHQQIQSHSAERRVRAHHRQHGPDGPSRPFVAENRSRRGRGTRYGIPSCVRPLDRRLEPGAGLTTAAIAARPDSTVV